MARIGFGITCTVAASSPGEVTNINIGGVEANMLNASYLEQSTGYNQFIAGMKTATVIGLEANWVGTNYATALGQIGTAVDVVVQVGNTDGSPIYTWENAIVSKVGEMSIELDGVVKWKMEFQPQGPPTITAFAD